jgi:hypothetical protein
VLAAGGCVRVTASAIDPAVLSQGAIDARVKASLAPAAARAATGTYCASGGAGGEAAAPRVATGAPALAAQGSDAGATGSLYSIDNGAFRAARPSVVITQGLCDVCAPSAAQLSGAVAALSAVAEQPAVVSLEPQSLRDVAESFVSVAAACGVARRGEALREAFVRDMRAICDASRACSSSDGNSSSNTNVSGGAEVAGSAASDSAQANGCVAVGEAPDVRMPSDIRDETASARASEQCAAAKKGRSNGHAAAHSSSSGDGHKRRGADGLPRMYVLEWLDPPFDAGHWVPEIMQVRLPCPTTVCALPPTACAVCWCCCCCCDQWHRCL